MSHYGFWRFRFTAKSAFIQFTFATITVLLVQMVSSEDLNPTKGLIETTDLPENKTISEDAGGKKHPIFNGTLEGLDFALIPGWNVNDDFDKWMPPIDIKQITRSYMSGFDNSSRPVWIHEMGKIDWPRYFEGTVKDQEEKVKCIRYLTWLMYKSKSLRSTQENPVTQQIIVVDMEGFKAEFVTDPKIVLFLKRAAFGYKRYYEKYSKKIIVINVNFIAEIVVNLLSRVQLGQKYTAEVEVYGTNKYEWGPKLTKYVPSDQLPEQYGGNKGFKPVFVID